MKTKIIGITREYCLLNNIVLKGLMKSNYMYQEEILRGMQKSIHKLQYKVTERAELLHGFDYLDQLDRLKDIKKYLNRIEEIVGEVSIVYSWDLGWSKKDLQEIYFNGNQIKLSNYEKT